jgi:hypothetical protein
MNGVLDRIADSERRKFCRNQRILLRHNGGLLNQPRLPASWYCVFPESPPFENLPLTLTNTF